MSSYKRKQEPNTLEKYGILLKSRRISADGNDDAGGRGVERSDHGGVYEAPQPEERSSTAIEEMVSDISEDRDNEVTGTRTHQEARRFDELMLLRARRRHCGVLMYPSNHYLITHEKELLRLGSDFDYESFVSSYIPLWLDLWSIKQS